MVTKKNKTAKQQATATNPFTGTRRKQHKAWMQVMGEGQLTFPSPKRPKRTQ